MLEIDYNYRVEVFFYFTLPTNLAMKILSTKIKTIQGDEPPCKKVQGGLVSWQMSRQLGYDGPCHHYEGQIVIFQPQKDDGGIRHTIDDGWMEDAETNVIRYRPKEFSSIQPQSSQRNARTQQPAKTRIT